MSDWYWRVIALKAAFFITCYASSSYYVRADDTIQKLPFCGPENVASDDLVIVSTLDGKVTAFSTQNGIQAWHVETQPLLSSNLHHVEVYQQLTSGGKWVRLVPSLRGTLYSLSGETIEPLPFDADQLLSSSFKYSEDLVIAGARETLWVGVDAATGHVVYECGSGGCASEQQASASRGLLVLRRHSNTVRALDPRTGQEKWNFSVAEHQLSLSRRECVGQATAGAPVVVAVALPEGVVAVMKPGERTPMWQQQLEAPVTAMWRLHGGSLQHIDVLWEATRSLVEGAAVAPPSLYIGVHNRQLYIQESIFYASQLETAVSTKPTPWKLVNSRPLLNGEQTALSPVQPDPNTLSLITLYGNTGQQGNHGFFLYLQETCDQAVQVMEDSFDSPESEQGNISDDQPEHHHVHVHVYSLWFWWKEVLLIAISSALLMNLMIWPRFFAPKLRPPTPFPINQEYIVVERHYERPPSERKMEYSGRYENDFTPLRCLGKGGFGVVFEAKNNIDHCSYAVKRITLPNRKSKRDRVLREVRVLAKLEHEHIVRYFNAWVEEPPPNWQEQRDAVWAKNLDGASVLLSDEYTNTAKSPIPGPAPKPANQKRGDSVLLNIQKPFDDCVDALDFEQRRLANLSKRNRSQSFNDSFSIIYDENENSKQSNNSNSSKRTATKRLSVSPPNTLSRHVTEYDESSSIVFEALPEAKIDCCDSFIKPDVQESYKSETTKSKKKKGHTRHWSLDLCVASAQSPFEPAPASKMYLYIQMQLCCRDNLHDWLLQNHTWETRGGKVKSLFSQIVSAVEYVHRAGLIHRDLKPSNILFAPDGRIKVGDFGLVTTTSDSSDDGDQDTRPQLLHTNRVGTELYMSPEQRRGQKYGCKVDIYSMGLILLELYHPCATDTERVSCLRAARSGVLPTTFRERHPEEVEVLELMLSEDPEQRPTARGLRCKAPLYELPDERWPDAI